MGRHANLYIAPVDPHYLGGWFPRQVDDKKSAWFTCPNCLLVGTLDDHEIDERGWVRPSVECTNCDFHEYIILDRWEKEE